MSSALMKEGFSAFILLLLLCVFPATNATLRVGFYERTCPDVEKLVEEAVAREFANNSRIAAGLIRMHFHDCFVRGCDASVLLDSTSGKTAEKESVANNPSLHGFEVIDDAKAAIEAQCPGVVSCADIIAFAARDSSKLAGNIAYQVPAGRRDGLISNASEVLENIPSPFMNASALIDKFDGKNLTPEEMVTLSGAHSIGVAHCAFFKNRLYNFSNTSEIDPSLSSAYAELLRNKCPADSIPTTPITTALDLMTPQTLDNKYYLGLQSNLGLLTSDHELIADATLAREVNDNANDHALWADKFARAMVKMGQIEVLTGNDGEIRKNCRLINGASLQSIVASESLSSTIATAVEQIMSLD